VPTWFAKQVDENKFAADPAEGPADTEQSVPGAATHRQRRVIHAPLLASAPAVPAGSGIRIKAQLGSLEKQVVLMIDRPVLTGYSFWCASPADAANWSPLALALFDSGGVASVLIHENNITVTHQDTGQESDDAMARRFGQLVRVHLESGLPTMAECFLATMPSEEQVKEALQGAIDDEINPGIAAHSGEITLTAVKGNTAYIKMGGGCQGCAASSVTLRQGVEQSFRTAVPQLGALLDETDHAAGRNPFFTVLPAGMGT